MVSPQEPGSRAAVPTRALIPARDYAGSNHRPLRRCAETRDLYEARLGPREGDERLSAKKRSESDEAAHEKRGKKPDKTGRKQRSADLGRALRSIYDDTLRESVPGDFLDLIGKLS